MSADTSLPYAHIWTLYSILCELIRYGISPSLTHCSEPRVSCKHLGSSPRHTDSPVSQQELSCERLLFCDAVHRRFRAAFPGKLRKKGMNESRRADTQKIGTKVPGGFLLPVSVVKKEKKKDTEPPPPNPLCVIQ